MKNKRIIVLCITAIVLIVTGLLYFSYGYYMTNITGTENSKKLTSLTKIFKFEFSDGTEKLVSNNTNFIPGSVLEKTFTIKNKSTDGVYFNIDLDEVTNTFSRTSDIIYEVYYNDEIVSTNTFPTTNASIATNLYIEKDGTRKYTLKVKYLDSEENQISDMGKSISASIVFGRTDSPKTKFNILGVSIQEKEMFDKSKMQTGFLPLTGTYPTTNSSYQNAVYEIIDIKKGQVFNITYYGKNPTNGRLRYIDSDTNEVVGTVGTASTDYYTSTSGYGDRFTNGTITAKKDFKLGVLYIAELPTNFDLSVKSVVPTVDNPIEIQSLGSLIKDENDKNYGKYVISTIATGKNLFNVKECINGTDILDNGDGSLTVKSYPSGTGKKLSQLAPNLKVGDEFVFSMKTNGYGAIYLLNQSANYKTYIGNNTKHVVSQNMLDSVVYLYKQTSAQGGAASVIKNIQIEKGNTATDYEAYKEPISTSIYLNEPLRCVGDICDYIDLINKKVVRKIGRIDFISASAFYEWKNVGQHGVTMLPALPSSMSRAKGMSNRVNNFTANNNVNNSLWLGVMSKSVYWVGILDTLGIYDESKTEQVMVSEFDEWLSNHPTYVIYQMSDSTEESISLPDISNFKDRTLFVTDGNLNAKKVQIE